MATSDDSPLICPYLGFQTDVQTRFTVPDDRHVCHQANPGQVIHPDYQSRCCLTSEYRSCQGYTAGWKHGLPRAARYRGRQRLANEVQAVARIFAIVLLAAAMVFVLYQAHAASPGPVQTILVIPVAPTSTATLTPTVTATATSIPSQTPTVQPGTPTPGPLAETPFGFDGQWLVHRVAQGESLEMIAQRYGTNVAVLRAINDFMTVGLWADTSVVICVGCVDASGLPVVKPYWVEKDTRLNDLAVQYGMDPAILRAWNGIEGDWVTAGRWLVVAGE